MPGLPRTAAVPWRRHPVGLTGPNTHCVCSACISAAHGVALAKLQPRSCAVPPALPLPAPPLPFPQGVATRDGILEENVVGGHRSSPACCSVLPAFPTTPS